MVRFRAIYVAKHTRGIHLSQGCRVCPHFSFLTSSDPNEGFETITELCGLLDQIHSLQKLIFAHFQPTSNNECRIAGLIPLVQES